MADIRKAFGAFVVQNWARILFDDEESLPGPKFDWPKTHAAALTRCWRRFRELVVNGGQNGGRTEMIPAAIWVRDIGRILRAPGDMPPAMSPATAVWLAAHGGDPNKVEWLSYFASVICLKRFEWTCHYWWTGAGPSDIAWAMEYSRRYESSFVPPPMPDSMPKAKAKLEDFTKFVEEDGPKILAPYEPTPIPPAVLALADMAGWAMNPKHYRVGHALATTENCGKRLPRPMRRLAWIAYPTALETRALRDSARIHLGSMRE